jgi:hypothetical protein
MAFLLRLLLVFEKSWSYLTLVFEEKRQFFRRKSQKIVIINTDPRNTSKKSNLRCWGSSKHVFIAISNRQTRWWMIFVEWSVDQRWKWLFKGARCLKTSRTHPVHKSMKSGTCYAALPKQKFRAAKKCFFSPFNFWFLDEGILFELEDRRHGCMYICIK